MKKKMSNRDKTFWAVVIPVVILFFAFNTLPMIKGVIYSLRLCRVPELCRSVYGFPRGKKLCVYV